MIIFQIIKIHKESELIKVIEAIIVETKENSIKNKLSLFNKLLSEKKTHKLIILSD